MDNTAFRLLYDNVHDFKAAAISVEAEIKRHDIRCNCFDPVSGMDGRTHHEAWVSMKAVSHFNLGTALELMLKSLLVCYGIPIASLRNRGGHFLMKLYDALHDRIAGPDPVLLERTYHEVYRTMAKDISEKLAFFVFVNTTSQVITPPSCPPSPDFSCLRGFLEFLDQDVILWKKRYSYESADLGDWRHYLNDMSFPVELIDRVMGDVPRDSLSKIERQVRQVGTAFG